MHSSRPPDSPGLPKGKTERLAPRLEITVLGGLSISFDGRPIPLGSRKALALLAFLALSETKSEQRERLAGLFWSDTTEQKARNSLRHVIFDLREALDSVNCRALTSERRTVAIDSDLLDLDIDFILSEVADGRVPDALISHQRVADTLLAGYEDLSQLFGEWITITRRAIQEQLLRALQRGYESEARTREQRRSMAEAAYLLDPLHEAACRVVMRLAAEDGETGPALRAYTKLYNALDEELDMEPSAPTLELVAKIKQGHFHADGSSESRRATARIKSDLGIGAPVVAVLPLRTIGPDPVPDYFAEGVVEDTVCKLATLREPVVISSNSTRALRGPEVNLSQVGRRLGAQYIVSGAVRRSGELLRLSVELADVASETVLWAGTYDTSEPRLFATQEEIANTIAQTLVPNLRNAELRRSSNTPPEELSAYHLVIQARDLVFRLEQNAIEAAGEMLKRATSIDPYYALSHAALAAWYSIRLGQGWSPDPQADIRSLESMARLAISLDNSNGRALALLGHNRTILSRAYDEALALFDRALQSSPNDAETLMWSSPTFAYNGEAEEAVRRAERAIALSPQDPFLFRYQHFLCIGHYAAGDYEAAAYWGRASLEQNPNYISNLRMTTAALSGLHKSQQARPLVDKVMELQPDFRVGPLVERQAFREVAKRELYGQHLVKAGLPL